MNVTETEFLIIGTRQQLSKVQASSISVGESRISSSKEVRNLGTWLDNTLSMSTHVSKVASSCFYYIYNIRRIRKYLSRGVCETLVIALITSRLDYCNSLLYGSPSSLLARLQRVQNCAARLIYNVSRTSSSSPLLINLHWLPVKHRILFKILLITYKSIHSLAPSILSSSYKLRHPIALYDHLMPSSLNILPSNLPKLWVIVHSL